MGDTTVHVPVVRRIVPRFQKMLAASTPVLCTGTQVVVVHNIQFAKPKRRPIPIERTLCRGNKNIIPKSISVISCLGGKCTVGLSENTKFIFV